MLLNWAPALGQGWVGTKAHAITTAGSALVVAGDFRTAGGKPHYAITLVDPQSGTVLPWTPPPTETAQFEATTAVAGDSVLAFNGYVGGNADSVNIYRLITSP